MSSVMKVRVVSKWTLLCFVLFSTTIQTTHTQDCTERRRGETIVIGIYGNNSITGTVSLCDGRQWRAVCDAGWDMNDAMVVCRQLGFPTEGTQFCTGSCYGSNDNIRGATNFACTGREQRLIDCTYLSIPDSYNIIGQRRFGRCNSPYGGLVCTRSLATPTESPPPCSEAATMAPPTSTSPTSHDNMPSLTTCPETSCDCTDTPTSSPETSCDCTATSTSESSTSTCSPCDCGNTSATTFGSDSDTDRSMQASSTTGRSVTTTVLGVSSAILLLILVGVVLGWVWSCHKNKQAVKPQGSSADNDLTNPTYSAATPTIPPVQYSSLGPRDTPTSGHTPGGEEDVYYVLGEVGAGEGQEGGAYEVPVQMGRDDSAGRMEEMEYSTLQHN